MGVAALVASGEASLGGITSATSYLDFIIPASFTLPASHYILCAQVHESADGQVNTAPGDLWAIGYSGFYGAADAAHAPTGVWLRVYRNSGANAGYNLMVHWAVFQVN